MERLRAFTIAGIAALVAVTVFYGAVVVPTAHDVMGSHREIGFVTRRVTGPLNALGCFVALMLVFDHLAGWKRRGRGRRIALTVTLGMVVAAQVGLLVLRAVLDGFLEPDAMAVSEPKRFLFLHERYLNLTSVLLLAAAIHGCLLWWESGEDRRSTA